MANPFMDASIFDTAAQLFSASRASEEEPLDTCAERLRVLIQVLRRFRPIDHLEGTRLVPVNHQGAPPHALQQTVQPTMAMPVAPNAPPGERLRRPGESLRPMGVAATAHETSTPAPSHARRTGGAKL